MAISVVQHKFSHVASGTGVAFDSDITAGSAIVVFAGNVGSTSFTISDSRSQSYTSIGYADGTANGAGASQMWYFLNAAAGATTVTVTTSGADVSVTLFEVSGDSLEFDASNFNADVLDNSAPYQPNVAVTAAAANHICLVGCIDINNSGTYTGGYGAITSYYAERAGVGTGYVIESTSGSRTLGLTSNTADYFNTHGLILKEASAALSASRLMLLGVG